MSDQIVVNGQTIDQSTDISKLLRQQFSGSGILSGRYDETPEPGVRSLFKAAAGTPLESRVVQSLTELLTDSDPRVRAGTVEIVQHFSDKFDAVKLLHILDKDPELFIDVPQASKGANADLRWALLRAIAGSSNLTQPVIKRLREAVVNKEHGREVLAGLAEHDADWIIEHAPEVIRNDLSTASALLFILGRPDRRERLVRTVPRESPELRKVLAEAVQNEVRDEGERHHLMALLQ